MLKTHAIVDKTNINVESNFKYIKFPSDRCSIKLDLNSDYFIEIKNITFTILMNKKIFIYNDKTIDIVFDNKGDENYITCLNNPTEYINNMLDINYISGVDVIPAQNGEINQYIVKSKKMSQHFYYKLLNKLCSSNNKDSACLGLLYEDAKKYIGVNSVTRTELKKINEELDKFILVNAESLTLKYLLYVFGCAV